MSFPIYSGLHILSIVTSGIIPMYIRIYWYWYWSIDLWCFMNVSLCLEQLGKTSKEMHECLLSFISHPQIPCTSASCCPLWVHMFPNPQSGLSKRHSFYIHTETYPKNWKSIYFVIAIYILPMYQFHFLLPSWYTWRNPPIHTRYEIFFAMASPPLSHGITNGACLTLVPPTSGNAIQGCNSEVMNLRHK